MARGSTQFHYVVFFYTIITFNSICLIHFTIIQSRLNFIKVELIRLIDTFLKNSLFLKKIIDFFKFQGLFKFVHAITGISRIIW